MPERLAAMMARPADIARRRVAAAITTAIWDARYVPRHAISVISPCKPRGRARLPPLEADAAAMRGRPPRLRSAITAEAY